MPSRPTIDVELLDSLARILQSTGVTPATMMKNFETICKRLAQRATPAFRQHLKDLPQIIGEWYRNPEYLNAQGAPRPLPLTGPVSLESLAQRVLKTATPASTIAALKHNRAIRATKQGYLPTDKRIVYVDDDVRAHALEAIRSLLSTLEHNLAQRQGPARLFECIASHPEVPTNALKPFDARVRPQAMEFLQRAYGDLTRFSRKKTGRSRTARLGVGVYVFEDRTSASTSKRRAR